MKLISSALSEPRTRVLAAGLLLIVVTLTAYLPVTRCGFIWDDDAYVEKNPNLGDADGLRRIWLDVTATPQYYPLVHTTFWLEHRIWGLEPAGYHMVNVLLHALAAVLLWRVLALLGVPGAWLAAAVFALHPVHVESVAWITERKNVLSAVFYLSSALAYLRYSLRGGRRGLYTLSLVLFAAALLSKTVTASLPAALLLLLWWKRPRLLRRDVIEVLPFLALGVCLGLLTVWLEIHHVGASGEEWGLSLIERLLLAGRVICFYAVKIIWPQNLSFIYPRWNAELHGWWQLVYPTAVIAVVALLWSMRDRVGKGPLVAVLFFIGTLAPALGFFDVYPMRYSYVADHFQYLASIGVIALLTASAHTLFQSSSRSRLAGLAAAVVVLMSLAALTWRQCSIYIDQESLWHDTLRKNPGSWMAHNNLGAVYQVQGRFEQAIHHFRETLRIRPEHARAHNNLGCLHHLRGEHERAIEHFHQALDLDPELLVAHYNLADAMAGAGGLEAARGHFKRVLELDPSHVSAQYKLGLLAEKQGRYREAAARFRTVLELVPGHLEAKLHLEDLPR